MMYACVYVQVCMYVPVCMYVQSAQSPAYVLVDQPGIVASPARGQLHGGNIFFPAPPLTPEIKAERGIFLRASSINPSIGT